MKFSKHFQKRGTALPLHLSSFLLTKSAVSEKLGKDWHKPVLIFVSKTDNGSGNYSVVTSTCLTSWVLDINLTYQKTSKVTKEIGMGFMEKSAGHISQARWYVKKCMKRSPAHPQLWASFRHVSVLHFSVHLCKAQNTKNIYHWRPVE